MSDYRPDNWVVIKLDDGKDPHYRVLAGWIDDQKTWAYRLANRPGKTIPQNILTTITNHAIFIM